MSEEKPAAKVDKGAHAVEGAAAGKPEAARSKMQRVVYRPGQRIFAQGEPADNAYIVEQGRVEITSRVASDQVVIGVVDRGGIVGEMALFDEAPRSATARTTEETTVMVIPRDELRKRLEVADPVLRRVVQILIQRLRAETRARVQRTTVVR